MKEKFVEIVVILDRSGSMSDIRSDAIGGFNEFLRQQKEMGGNAYLTMIQFDDQYECVYNHVPIREARELTNASFVPRGMTALNDAIGRTINMVNKKVEEETYHYDSHRSGEHNCCRPRVICAILTDGQENCSKEFTTQKINDMVSHQRSCHNWEFVFLAANQDAFATSRAYGFNPSFTWCYAADAVGTRSAFDNMSISTSCLREEDNDDGNKIGKQGV